MPGESQGQRSLAGCHLWGRTESDTTEVTAAAAAVTIKGNTMTERAGGRYKGGERLRIIMFIREKF